MSSCSGTMMSLCSCLRKNNCNKIAVAEKFHHSYFIAILSNTKADVCGDRYRSARGVRVTADGVCCCNRSIVKHAMTRGGGNRDTRDCTRGADRRDDCRRTFEAALHRHVGVFLVRVDCCPEPVCIKWCTARTGDIAVARALSCARTVTDTVTISCTVARASSCT